MRGCLQEKAMLENIKKITGTVSKHYWAFPLIIVICIFVSHDLRHVNFDHWKIIRIYTFAIALFVLIICSAIILIESRTITAKKYSILYLTLFIATLSYYLNFYSYEVPPLYNLKIGPWLTLIVGFIGFKILRSTKSLSWKIAGYFVSFLALLFSSFILLLTAW